MVDPEDRRDQADRTEGDDRGCAAERECAQPLRLEVDPVRRPRRYARADSRARAEAIGGEARARVCTIFPAAVTLGSMSSPLPLRHGDR